jgi:hypothetical protein
MSEQEIPEYPRRKRDFEDIAANQVLRVFAKYGPWAILALILVWNLIGADKSSRQAEMEDRREMLKLYRENNELIRQFATSHTSMAQSISNIDHNMGAQATALLTIAAAAEAKLPKPPAMKPPPKGWKFGDQFGPYEKNRPK